MDRLQIKFENFEDSVKELKKYYENFYKNQNNKNKKILLDSIKFTKKNLSLFQYQISNLYIGKKADEEKE